MKKLLFLLLFSTALWAQKPHNLYLLQLRLTEGETKALYDIAPYFDNDSIITEYLGYHVLTPSISRVAKRMVTENSLFTKEEIVIDTATTAKHLLNFLTKNKSRITFSDDASAFLITPLKKREVKFRIKQVSQARMVQLNTNRAKLMLPQWVSFSTADSLIQKKDPKALMVIASEFFKKRSRFNKHYFRRNEFTDLLQLLTGTIIGVENEKQEITWHADKDYTEDSSLNMLIYFTKYYKDYKWDTKNEIFVNRKFKATAPEKESLLFEKIIDDDKAVALTAFIELTTCNPEKVKVLCKEYNASSINANWEVPMFPYRFLEQLTVLTAYCNKNKIDYTGSGQLRNDIEVLKTKLPFKERRKLEDKLISSLTLDEITAFEYWCLIYQKSDRLSFSAGRILDVFYSKNRKDLLTDKKHLDCYLKKSVLFYRLGIHGIVWGYNIKFLGIAPEIIYLFDNYESDDNDIKFAAKRNVALQAEKQKLYPMGEMDTTYYHVKNFETKLDKILKGWNDSEEHMDTLELLLSEISYHQIGIALKSLEKKEFKKPENVYSFLNRDFGFFLLNNAADKQERQEFSEIYSKFTEFELYQYYLDHAGIDYKNADGSLDLDKVYNLIKYNAVRPLTGSNTMDNEVYSLIKLLEITFKTTLGMSNKYCCSQNMYSCNSANKANAWMQYLKKNKVLKLQHDEPISFHAFYD